MLKKDANVKKISRVNFVKMLKLILVRYKKKINNVVVMVLVIQ